MMRNRHSRRVTPATQPQPAAPTRAPMMIELLETRQLLSASASLLAADPYASAPLPAYVVGASTPLGAPTALTATAASPIKVELSWSAGDQSATGYVVQRSTDGGRTFASLATIPASSTTYTDANAPAGKTSLYRVRAVAGSSVSTFTGAVSVTTNQVAVPTQLAATASNPITVALSWTSTEQAATGFTVQRSTDGGRTFVKLATTAAGVTAYTDATAPAGKTSLYRVCAVAGASASSFGAAVAVTTAPLAAPSELTATAANPVTVALSWTNNEQAASGFVVQRSTDGGKTFVNLVTLNSAGTTAYTDTAALAGKVNLYRVRAFVGNNTSAFTANATVTPSPMAAPSGLTATALSSNGVSVSWTNNEDAATGYVLQRSVDGGKTYVTVATITKAGTTSYTDTAAASAKANLYRVKATAGASASDFTAATTVVTPMATSTGLAANPLSATSVKLGWCKNDVNATGVYVLRSSDGGQTFVKVATLGKVLTWIDATVAPSSAYQYKVQGFNAAVTADPSTASSAVTPLGPAAGLTATVTGLTQVTLAWTNTDASHATGLYVLRSVDGGKTWGRIATLGDSSVTSYVDAGVFTGNAYTYTVQAFSANAYAANAASVKLTVPVGAATGLAATATGPTSVGLTWQITDSTAGGYNVLRSTDGKSFSQIASLKQPGATSYTDTTAASGKRYYYKVVAFKGSATAASSDAASAVTPLLAPTGLAASATGLSVKLTWSAIDKNATGVYVLRSNDGGQTFTSVATLKATQLAYTDANLTGDVTYTYKLQAYNAVATSAGSATVTATPNGTSVNISTRYGNEVVITASGSNDSIAVSQSGSTLTILADGKTFTAALAAGGSLFVYTRSGTDTISIDASVGAFTTVETIDACNTTVTSAAAHVSVWIDSTDTFNGTGTVHRVANFAAGVTKNTGAALANPTDAGVTKKIGASLWGGGPVMDDVNQGGVGDCYFLASLAAFAGVRADVLRESAVDMGDGTFAVQFFSAGGAASYVRVSNDFSTGYFNGCKFAYQGASGSIWAMVMEKAFCYFRTGKNTYASISGGWMGSVYTNLGIDSTWFSPNTKSDDALYALFESALAKGEPITLATFSGGTQLVSNHAYTLVGVSTDANGVHHYTVRNPWGVKGDALEDADGFATLTYAQLVANFTAVALATT